MVNGKNIKFAKIEKSRIKDKKTGRVTLKYAFYDMKPEGSGKRIKKVESFTMERRYYLNLRNGHPGLVVFNETFVVKSK